MQTKKLSHELLDELFLYLIFGIVIGARLGHIVFYELDFYLSNPLQILKVWEGGLSSHGGAIGTFIAYLIFLWKNKKEVRFWDYLDPIAIAATMPIAFVRMGNFFNSEIVGRPTDLPWGVEFSRYDTIIRHPSQLYEFTIGIFLFIVLFFIWQKFRKSLPEGFFLGLLLTSYFLLRFLVEFVKEYPLHENLLNLTTGQLLSIPGVLMGITLTSWLLLRTRTR